MQAYQDETHKWLPFSGGFMEGVDAFVQEVMRGENEDDQGEEDQGGTTEGEGRE